MRPGIECPCSVGGACGCGCVCLKNKQNGAVPKTIESIILHSFGQIETRHGLEAYGIGISLSIEGNSYASASCAGPDEDGVCYMVLCQVITGNMEEILVGSWQFLFSNEEFDSGVDSSRDPTHYIVWSINMNTYILPEYVVSLGVLE